MNERLYKFTTIQLAIQVHIMHSEIIKHQLLLRHWGDIHGNVHMLLHVPKNIMKDKFQADFFTLSLYLCLYEALVVPGDGYGDDGPETAEDDEIVVKDNVENK